MKGAFFGGTAASLLATRRIELAIGGLATLAASIAAYLLA